MELTSTNVMVINWNRYMLLFSTIFKDIYITDCNNTRGDKIRLQDYPKQHMASDLADPVFHSFQSITTRYRWNKKKSNNVDVMYL